MKQLVFFLFLFTFFTYSQTQIGQDINGEASNDWLGCSVSLSDDGSTLAIGAPFNDGNGADSGHVRVYRNVSGVWN